jgi:hypothetical protein
MPEQGMNEIVSELLRLSKDRKLSWNQTRKDNEYRVSFPDMSFSISFDSATRTYKLDMISEIGTIIDSLRSEAPRSAVPEADLHDIIKVYGLASSYIKETNIKKALAFLKSR